jgi:hypothetical protein
MAWPGDIESVTVTWMDDRQETYSCNTIGIEDGELRLSTVYKSGISFSRDTVRDERAVPLANVRVRVVNRVQ